MRKKASATKRMRTRSLQARDNSDKRKVPQHGNAHMNVATMYGIIYLTEI
jgi:hypothetical protein